ncbi:TadE-like protein [Fulvimarina pelagi HTCC2506]|uniref:TadE-like protein n=1 Tax=Fulvimarina pelagi HTCC2506 TaxID=314231 RepID=Q0G4J0_9HYPH|nr:TadE/TadG family type IV pilus assembly protein [Fulvimarina pelagi]EAU41491.1 TadE-like protein [Fulvimarina pelagi HTCC2506]
MKRPLCSGLCGLIKQNDGVAAIEFSLVALPLFAAIFFFFEIALLNVGNVLLNRAVEDASRAIRVGQLSTEADARKFRHEICSRYFGVVDCDKLIIDVRSYEEFSDVTDHPPITRQVIESFRPSIDLGEASDIIAVRIIYSYSPLFSFIFESSRRGSDEVFYLATAKIFRNEPFE